MISYYTLFTFLLVHWIFDFHLQTDKMAQEKSKSNGVLMDHCTVYAFGILIMILLNKGIFSANPVTVLYFFIVNFLAHFLTDWVTSRATSALYEEGRTHDFFVVVGADQMIHYITLFGTFVWLTQ